MGALADFFQGASNSAASTVSAPVDGIAWLLRKAGIDTGTPVMGSDWMRAQGLTAEPQNHTAGILGEALGGVAPMLAAAKAPQIAGALTRMEENAMVPATLNSQAGMIRIPGRGQIPETRGDVNRLANKFGGLLDDAGVAYTADKSGVSPAQYFSFKNPATSADDVAKYGAEQYKVRISDHQNVHGADFSVDPVTGKTFEEMVKAVRELGVPLADKVKPLSKAKPDDDVLRKIVGPLENLSPEAIEHFRNKYVMGKHGYWIDKDAKRLGF